MTNSSDAGALGVLEPAGVWGFFSQISRVPRPSKKEERIRHAVRTMAEERGLSVREDATGNLVIDVPASAGCENAPATALQAHLDMVCEKNSDCAHDFDREGISLIVDRDAESGETIVRADGTTLGADNGIGVAMALAAASDPAVTHGPLELVFTVDEEAGMSGAKALTPESFGGRRLVNLDAEEDDILYIGCAGGCDATLSFDLEPHAPEGGKAAWRVAVSGLRGGHSGGDIHENRGNAIKLLVRTLSFGLPEALQLGSIKGGQLRNAIPREAEAVVLGPPEAAEALRDAARTVQEETICEHAEERASINIEPVALETKSRVLSVDDSWRVLSTLVALPHGVLGMDLNVPGLVETSNNVASVSMRRIEGRQMLRVTIGNLARSSSEAQKQAAIAQIAAVGSLAGASVETGNEYPGWKPNPDSPTLAVCRQVYEQLFGEAPTVTAIHAGVECGIIGQRVGITDMVSLGPKILGAHSPDERLYVDSVQKSWKFLVGVLAELARG